MDEHLAAPPDPLGELNIPSAEIDPILPTGMAPRSSSEESSTAGWMRPIREPVYLPRPIRERTTHFIALEKREGVVLEVGDEEFEARLVDTLGDSPDVVATFPFEDLSVDGRRLLKPGAVFYWNVGYTVSAAGQRSRVADLVFRRVPARRDSDLSSARKRARAIRRELGVDD